MHRGAPPPTRGEITLRGKNVTKSPEELAVVFQEYGRSLMPWTSVRNNVLLPLRHKPLGQDERARLVEEALESVGLTRFIDHYPWQLSGGMQQRVAIARALAYQPTILLMDEPFASVDAQTRGDLEDLVLRVREEDGITILFVTHDIDESVYLADRVVVLTHSPTEVKEIVQVDLGRPRDQITTKELPEFVHLRGHVYRLIKRELPVPVSDSIERKDWDEKKAVCAERSWSRSQLALLFGGSASSASSRTLATINLRTLNIANALPLDLGVQKGFFSKRGIEIKKKVLQSGNDVVLALANSDGDIGYLGYVPAMIGRSQGIKFQMISASEVEGTSADDNWQNIMVKGSSSIRTPQDLAGKTIAVNALKGVGEVMIKAALKKVGVDPNSPKLVAIGFGAMRSALNNGQIDAFWAPEPFVSQGLNIDGDRIVMAPGRCWASSGRSAATARWTAGSRRTRSSRSRSTRRSTSRWRMRRRIPTRSARCCRRGPRTSACRSGARWSTATSSSSLRSTRRSSA